MTWATKDLKKITGLIRSRSRSKDPVEKRGQTLRLNLQKSRKSTTKKSVQSVFMSNTLLEESNGTDFCQIGYGAGTHGFIRRSWEYVLGYGTFS